MRGELPPKLFFRIGEVAALVGVEPHVLRYWEREFRSIRPTKSAKGQRVYSRKDVDNLLRVRDLLYRDGFTIAGAKRRMLRGEGAVASEPTEGAPATARRPASSARAPASNEAPTGAAPTPSPSLRDALLAVRGEVSAFLEELSRDVSGAAPAAEAERPSAPPSS